MAEKITYDSKEKLYGLAIPGTANSGMSASTTTIVAAELAGFGNDYFNTHYFMQIIKDADGAGSAPEGEIRQVTDYVSSSGTFTTDAFSGNVEEGDEFLLLHNSISSILVPTVSGQSQLVATTIDLQQAAASYDLFTGTGQDVVTEGLIFRLPNVDVSDDATITSISIQSDDVTPSTFLSTAAGVKSNLTAEAQLAANINNGILIKVGTKIQLTIAGGASDDATICDVIAHYRSVVSGGTLS